jgi:hypothetical protein
MIEESSSADFTFLVSIVSIPFPGLAGYILHGPAGASPAMTKKVGKDKKKSNNGANLGFEQQLWQMADKLRGHALAV